MKEVILLNIKRLFFIIISISFVLYCLIHSDKQFLNILSDYFKWIFNFTAGNYGQSTNGSNIVLFNFQDYARVITIGPK